MEAELTDEQTGLVASFSGLTGADSETASHVLEAHAWDLNASVDFFLENGARPMPAAPQDPVPQQADEPIVIDDDDDDRDAALARALSEEPSRREGLGLGVQGTSFARSDFPGFPLSREAGAGGSPPGGAAAPPRNIDNEEPELPDGINAEEARMLEAVMLGTAYQGHIPDFSNPPPPENLDPAVVQQRLLREEQDAAFQESLRADRERQEAQEAEQRAEEEAQRQAREQEVLERRRKEEEERAAARLVEDKRQRLGREPASGEDGAVQVQVRLPDGSRLTRMFKTADPMPLLFDFVDVAVADTAAAAGEGASVIPPGSYTLGTQFPRRVFEPSQEGTLESNGLNHKQEALFMQPK